MSGAAAAREEPAGRAGFPAPATLRLLPLEPDPPSAPLMRWLTLGLSERLPVEVKLQPPLPHDPAWGPPKRARFSSGAIVDTLIRLYPQPEERSGREWVLAVTTADLEGGGREYVFGEATMGGTWAVIGTARLGAAGSPEFRSRLLKEALHELGHLAGLGHCADGRCLMASSPDLDAVDRKEMEICAACRGSIHSAGNGT